MTRDRVAGLSPERTTQRSAAKARGLAAAWLAATLALVVVLGACGNVTSSPATSSAAPSGSPGASGAAGARPTAWPGNAVLGIEALGVADGPILAAINDFNRGIATEDLALMRRAADGLAGLDVLLPNIDKINIYDPMKSFAERYGAAIRGISAAARDVRAAIDAGDAAAITTSSQALITSLGAYTDVQPELAMWVGDSIKQRRLLLR
jgi:hypothetical protein